MGAGHHKQQPESRRLRRAAYLLLAPIALLTLVALIWLWPTGDVAGSNSDRATIATEVEGEIVSIERTQCDEELPDDVNGCGRATIRLDDGAEVEAPLPNGAGAPLIAEGDGVVVVQSESPDGDVYGIVDHQRSTQLWTLVIAFALALVAFGRWRGVTALVGLVATFVVLTVFVVPAILRGESPVMVAIVGSATIAITVLYLTHGFGLATTVALLGTLASLALTGLLAALTTGALHLTGVTDDLSAAVSTTYGIDMASLLLAGIIIGSLGVLDDVTITQAATVGELARANRNYSARQLFGSAMRVGRSHIASVVNTIVLAYAGASLPILVLSVADNDSLLATASDQFLAQEIVRSLVATLGLIAAVPITTALAALALRQAESGRPT